MSMEPLYKLGNEKLCKINDTAQNKLVQLLTTGNKFGLRIRVIGGGCSGLQYQMELADQAGKGDLVVERDGARVVIDTKSALFVGGCELTYSDDLQHSGFKVINPHAKQHCGCGESFSA